MAEKKAKETASNTKLPESPETVTDADAATAFAVIEKVTVYADFDGNKPTMDIKTCMSASITIHINNTFNINLATLLKLNGKHKILVSFKIAKTGQVTNVTVTGSQPNLEQEAIRTIGRLPDMKHGMQRGKPVGVIYGLPITFMVK
jgi:protein TonB